MKYCFAIIIHFTSQLPYLRRILTPLAYERYMTGKNGLKVFEASSS